MYFALHYFWRLEIVNEESDMVYGIFGIYHIRFEKG